VAIYIDCGGELVGELFWTEIAGGSMWYLPYSIKDDNHNYYSDYKLLWAKVFFV
jgi:hypothetical protein